MNVLHPEWLLYYQNLVLYVSSDWQATVHVRLKCLFLIHVQVLGVHQDNQHGKHFEMIVADCSSFCGSFCEGWLLIPTLHTWLGAIQGLDVHAIQGLVIKPRLVYFIRCDWVLCSQSKDCCAKLRSKVCAGQSMDRPDPYLVHNVHNVYTK